MALSEILRYAAFTDTPTGGNPAGLVLDACEMTDAEMLAIAAELGYSESAFLCARTSPDATREYDIKYFSPLAQVPFCGHATVAAAVALAERDGPGKVVFDIGTGEVPVETVADASGAFEATLTSVAPYVEEVPAEDIAAALALLSWAEDELDPTLPPRIGFAGARHLILAATSRDRLARLDYDFDGLGQFMLDRDLTTVDLVWRQDARTFYARNPFPVGGTVEDPATGAAAAAFGAYLRELGAVDVPARIRVLQGQDMGRPSELMIDVDADRPEIRVSGRAVPIH